MTETTEPETTEPETTEPRTIKELREVAEKADKIFCEEDLTVEEVMIVTMMIRETAAANLAARAVMEKISMDMKKVVDLVESGTEVRVVELKPSKQKKVQVMPPHATSNN